MANDWNPDDPAALGVQWLPHRSGTAAVLAGSGFAQRLESTSAETIAQLRMRIASDPTVTAPLYTICDIIPAGDEVVTPQSVVLSPNEDVATGSNPNDWVTATGGTSNLYQQIDDQPVQLPIDGDHIHVRSTATSSQVAYRCHVDTSALPSTARILNVSIVAVDSVTGLQLAATIIEYKIQHSVGGVYTPPNSAFGQHVFGHLREIPLGEINPQTGHPWTAADIAEFDSSGDWTIRIQGTNAAGGNARATLWKLGLKVDYVDVENRVAYGIWTRPAGALPDDIDLNVLTAGSGASNWSKPSSGTFTYLWRAARALMITGNTPTATDIAWHTLAQDLGELGNPPGRQPPPVSGMRGCRFALDQFGIPTTEFVESPEVAAISLRTTDPATSDDSQCYSLGSLADLAILTSSTTNGVGQRMHTSADGDYQSVRFIVVPPTSGGGDLVARVWDVDNSVFVGGEFRISAADVRALPDLGNGWRYVQGNLNAVAPLVTGTQYELRFTTSGSGQWVFAGLRTHSGAGSASYGGTTDSARIGGTTSTTQDLAANLLVMPPAPTNVRARIVEEQLDPDKLCGVHAREMVLVEWDEYTALGGAFDHFALYRNTDDGSNTLDGWQLIKRIRPGDRTSAADHEAPRARPSQYRLVAVATTAQFSEPADSDFVTPHAKGAELIFTSNARPDLTVVYDTEPVYEYELLDQDGDQLVRIAGRQYQVAFIDPDERGMSDTYRLIVNFGRQPVDTLGRLVARKAVFMPLRNLVRALDKPYVAVLDAYGNVTYAHVQLSRMVNEEAGYRYHTTAVVTPLTDVPGVVEDGEP